MEKFPNKRIFAFLIDIIFIVIINELLFNKVPPQIFKSFFILPIIIEVIYFLLRDGLFGGQSIGKWITGLRVAGLEGNRCTFMRSFFRNIIFIIPIISIAIEYFVMAYSKDGRRLGDRLARTRVIDNRPHVKDSRFLLFSLILVFVFFIGIPAYRFVGTEREAPKLVEALKGYKEEHGVYPEKLDQLQFKPKYYFVYTRYNSHEGNSEFFLTGIAAPFPDKISYSSQRKEWRKHRGSMAWSKEELGITTVSSEAEAHYGRGLELQKNGSLDEAIREYREAIRLMSDFVNARLGLALTLKEKGLLDDAVREYQEVIKLKPDNPEARLGLFMALFKQERAKEALEAYRNYIKIAPPKNEEELKRSEGIIKALEKASQPSEIEKEAAPVDLKAEEKLEKKQEPTESHIPKAGKRYIILLKNGNETRGVAVSADSKGLWIEIRQGGQVYLRNEEIKEIIETNEATE